MFSTTAGLACRPRNNALLPVLVLASAPLIVLALAACGARAPATHAAHVMARHAQYGTGRHSIEPGLAAPADGDPLFTGVQTDLAGAARAVGYNVITPTDTQRSGTLMAVWADGQRGMVALVYSPDLTIYQEPATYSDPATEFQNFINQNSDVTATLGTADERTALIIEPGTDAYSNPAVVEFDYNGIDISLYSSIYSTSTLVLIANSMK